MQFHDLWAVNSAHSTAQEALTPPLSADIWLYWVKRRRTGAPPGAEKHALFPVLGSITLGSMIWERSERWRLNRFTLGALKRSSVWAWTQRSEARAPEQTTSKAWKCNMAPSDVILALAMQVWRWNSNIHGYRIKRRTWVMVSKSKQRVATTWKETFSRSRVSWLNFCISYLFSSPSVCSGKKSSSQNAAASHY